MNVSVRHDQREKPNNLKLVQRTKVLIHNQLVDKAKARLPTFLHNLHLVVCYIFLMLNNIHQITTCRLFDSIQFCVVPFFVTHRIFLWAPLLFLLIVISQNVILSVKPHLSPDKLYFPDFGWLDYSCSKLITYPWNPTISRTKCISRVNGFRNWCFIIETTKKYGKAMSRKAFFAAHCTHRFDPLHWGRLSEKSNIPQWELKIR